MSPDFVCSRGFVLPIVKQSILIIHEYSSNKTCTAEHQVLFCILLFLRETSTCKRYVVKVLHLFFLLPRIGFHINNGVASLGTLESGAKLPNSPGVEGGGRSFCSLHLERPLSCKFFSLILL